MPEAGLFSAGYGFHQGMKLNGYELTDMQIEHHQVKRYREYSYPTKLTWSIAEPNHNFEALKVSIQQMVQGNKIINSSYGNPYSCSFGNLSFQQDASGKVIVTSTGNCFRVYR